MSQDLRNRLRIVEKVNLDTAWSFQHLHLLTNSFALQRNFEYTEVFGILTDFPRPSIMSEYERNFTERTYFASPLNDR